MFIHIYAHTCVCIYTYIHIYIYTHTCVYIIEWHYVLYRARYTTHDSFQLLSFLVGLVSNWARF